MAEHLGPPGEWAGQAHPLARGASAEHITRDLAREARLAASAVVSRLSGD